MIKIQKCKHHGVCNSCGKQQANDVPIYEVKASIIGQGWATLMFCQKCLQEVHENVEQECVLDMEEKKINWFEVICERVRDYSEGEIWSTGFSGCGCGMILCKTESAANALADMLELLYEVQGDNVTANTGYFDPEEDKRNHEEDACTGWWYVSIS